MGDSLPLIGRASGQEQGRTGGSPESCRGQWILSGEWILSGVMNHEPRVITVRHNSGRDRVGIALLSKWTVSGTVILGGCMGVGIDTDVAVDADADADVDVDVDIYEVTMTMRMRMVMRYGEWCWYRSRRQYCHLVWILTVLWGLDPDLDRDSDMGIVADNDADTGPDTDIGAGADVGVNADLGAD